MTRTLEDPGRCCRFKDVSKLSYETAVPASTLQRNSKAKDLAAFFPQRARAPGGNLAQPSHEGILQCRASRRSLLSAGLEYCQAFPTIAGFARHPGQTAAQLMHDTTVGSELTVESKADLQIQLILQLADRMISISNDGFRVSDDDGCLLLNGTLRECAYQLRDAAEREQEVHRSKGHRIGRQERIGSAHR